MCEAGQHASGEGVIELFSDVGIGSWKAGTVVYRGRLIAGKPEGAGSLVMQDGVVYKGTFLSGLMDGEGRYIGHKGVQFFGSWQEGTPDGVHRMVHGNKSIICDASF